MLTAKSANVNMAFSIFSHFSVASIEFLGCETGRGLEKYIGPYLFVIKLTITIKMLITNRLHFVLDAEFDIFNAHIYHPIRYLPFPIHTQLSLDWFYKISAQLNKTVTLQ